MTVTTKSLQTPKFLTEEMARTAVRVAIQTILNPPDVDQHGFGHEELKQYLKPTDKQCYVVILVPGVIDHVAEGYHPDWPDYPLNPVLLYEHCERDGVDVFEAKFRDIAKNSALQLWTDRNDGRTDSPPHLLFQGDTPHSGGVKRHGIVVTCAGAQHYTNKLISAMVVELLVAMASAAWESSADYRQYVDFVT